MSGQELPEVLVPPPGPRTRELGARLARVESPAFEARRAAREAVAGAEQTPVVYARGEGSNVWDADGNRYVDLVAGFGALALGHAPTRVLDAAEAQARRLGLALGDVYGSDVKLALCERLAALLPEPGARVMLGLSGADAVTAALKTAALATGKSRVVAFTGGYHGLSHGPLAACGLSEGFRAPFAGQLGDFVTFVPYPETDVDACIAQVSAALDAGSGAVLVEPLLGRGGCVVPPPGFLAALRRACDEHRALLVCDEIWTGLGRAGAWLASTDAGVTPDLVCVGKALGAGLPVSACIGRDRVMASWGARGGTALHTATHFGWPTACAAALECLRAVEELGLLARSREVGARFQERLRGAGFAARGRALMVGVPMRDARHALATTRALLRRGWLVLTGGERGDVLTLTPALTIDEALLDAFVPALQLAAAETT